MVRGTTAQTGATTEQGAGGFVPGPRVSPESPGRSHRAPSLAELVAEAMQLIRRDDLPISGYLVVKRKGSAIHQHAVWQLGPFALLDDGWFGQVHGFDSTGADASRWLRRHERRCEGQHWTHFRWIDPASLTPGCGAAGIGIGLGPDGPTYCPGHAARDENHPSHVALAEVLRNGLRALAHGATA
ncbi:hypothetical protein [Marmoricola sp. RAF53]|uniref:hypothetical protein n=1 Tax=Marmoricola sp. RAF53 TaxID=3233059 RepID=UPI003F99780C